VRFCLALIIMRSQDLRGHHRDPRHASPGSTTEVEACHPLAGNCAASPSLPDHRHRGSGAPRADQACQDQPPGGAHLDISHRRGKQLARPRAGCTARQPSGRPRKATRNPRGRGRWPKVRPRGLTGGSWPVFKGRASPELRPGSPYCDWAATPRAASQSLGKTPQRRLRVARCYQNEGNVAVTDLVSAPGQTGRPGLQPWHRVTQ